MNIKKILLSGLLAAAIAGHFIRNMFIGPYTQELIELILVRFLTRFALFFFIIFVLYTIVQKAEPKDKVGLVQGWIGCFIITAAYILDMEDTYYCIFMDGGLISYILINYVALKWKPKNILNAN